MSCINLNKEIDKMPTDDVQQMIEDCLNRESKLNAWELGFIQGLSESYPEYSSLSPAQQEKLDEIWERVT